MLHASKIFFNAKVTAEVLLSCVSHLACPAVQGPHEVFHLFCARLKLEKIWAPIKAPAAFSTLFSSILLVLRPSYFVTQEQRGVPVARFFFCTKHC